MKKCFFIIAIIVSFYSSAINFDQNFQVKTYSVNEGLSQFDASMIIQDDYGLIWISTYDGLNRFDGNDFVQFRHDPTNPKSIHGNRVLNLYIDSKKNFWIITESGKIDRFNFQNEEFEHFDFEPLKYAIVTSFYEDSKKNFWIGTTNGLYRTRLKENSFAVEGIFLNSSSPGIDNFILSIIEDKKLGILVGTPSGGVLLSDRGGQIYSPSKFLEGLSINSFHEDSNKTMWIATSRGLFSLQNKHRNANSILGIKDFYQQQSFANTNVNDIKLLDNNNYIVLTGNALYRLQIPQEIKTEIKLSSYLFFENNAVKSIFIDKTKNLWIHSLNKGVAKIDLFQKSSIIDGNKHSEGLVVKSVFKDSRNRVWVGANSNGLYYYDKNEPLKRVAIPTTPYLYFLISPTIVEDAMGDIWFTVSGVVYCYNYQTNKVNPLTSIYPNSAKLQSPFALAIDKYDYLWIGCANGLVRLNLTDKNEKPLFVSVGSLSDMFSSEQISRLVFDKIHNIVWTCTKDNGVTAVFLNNVGKVTQIKRLVHGDSENSISSDHVWSVVVASDSVVWFGTDSGLSYCTIENDSLTVKSLSCLHLVGSSKIMSIAEDSHCNLWLGTSQALFRYNTITKTEKRFTVKDGLFTSAMLEGMHIDRQNDLLYVGTTNGLNIINTAGQSSNPYPAKVQIVDFLIYGKSIKSNPELYQHLKAPLYNTKEIKLNYKENNFSINFLATHYNDFDKNMYIYKLEGYDTDSITTDYKNRTASYNNLPAGTYRFWVKASNNDNNWRGEIQYLTIVVKSAPWLTIWAYLIYLCIAGLIISVVFRYLNRETKLKQQLIIKEIEVQHEAEINNMKLRFHTNIAHDIRTPLTLISAPLEDIKNNHTILSNPFLNDRIEIIEKNVSRLLYLVNQFLDFRRLLNDGNSLHAQTHFAPTAFAEIKESFVGFAKSKNIRYEFIIDINDHYLIFDLDKLTKILFNLISNSFKFTPDGGDIYVFVEQQNKSLVLKVVDTGCGIPEKDLPNIFQRFYQATDSANGTGIGLSLVKQLVDLCKGIIDIESKEGQGTQFTINIPILIASEVIPEDPKNEKGEIVLTTENKEPEFRKATILVVEDDNDLRSYLVKSLIDKYSVFESVNGQDGFDKALRYTPDIILTDVMMPQVDGVALIKMVRNDYRTSHIPIIVLTAKTGENEEIAALEAGAEDFIAKPFSTKSLFLKVNNYIRSLSAKKQPEHIQIHSKIVDREQAFLNEMNKVILENLENPIFSIDFLCEKLAISRMQLHRKIVSLLGKSTSEYIREIKLDEAKKYIENGEHDIETVMLKIGLNSCFHFNKNFKARFGITIQDFIKNLKQNNTSV